MYRPRPGKRRDQGAHHRKPNRYVEGLLSAITVVFWASASIFLGLTILYGVTKDVGTLSTRATGISLLLVAVSSGAITWKESRDNPLDDAERGEWTNRMLFYGLVCVFSFIIACLYLPALYFAR